jgi:2-methylcitrate dehydratase PrpD
MDGIDRRSFIAGVGTMVGLKVTPARSPPADATTEHPLVPPVTEELADYVAGARHLLLPSAVRKEGTRTLFNWVGVAIGGSREDAVDIAAAALAPFSGVLQAGLFGRSERLDALNASFVNGLAGHVLDYDDTHLKTVIHPAAAVAPALFAYADHSLATGKPIAGSDFLAALVIGMEVECRIGNAVYPNHYAAGWHITGTTGVIGATAGLCMLMHLDQEKTAWALGLAASQPVGLRESFGTMNKSFNPGRAASNALFAATLAARGFTSSRRMLEAKAGWMRTLSTKQDYREITDGLGQHYEASLNTYKPFPCGIVLHPAIDAALQIHAESNPAPDSIQRIELKVNSLVLDLTGQTSPRTGLESKFSVYHAVAVALIEGAAGTAQFSDRAAADPAVIALRTKVKPLISGSIRPEEVEMLVVLNNGGVLFKRVEHAIGSLERPMSNADLERKFLDVASKVLPQQQVRRTMELCWSIEQLTDSSDIIRCATST